MPDSQRHVSISRFNRVLAVTIVVLALALVGAQFASGFRAIVIVAPVSAWAIYLAVVVLWMPRLEVDEHAIIVANPVSTVTIPFEAIILLETRYALTIHTPGKRVAVWVAPSPGVVASARVKYGARSSGAKVDSTVPVSQIPGTESGDAYTIISRRWRQLVDSELLPLGQADTADVVTSWNTTALLWSIVPVALTIVAAIVA